jgi:hypothetical protein
MGGLIGIQSFSVVTRPEPWAWCFDFYGKVSCRKELAMRANNLLNAGGSGSGDEGRKAMNNILYNGNLRISSWYSDMEESLRRIQ